MTECVFDIDRLREIAMSQYGYVSVAQALDVSVSRASLSTMVKRGRLERPVRGVYRVPYYEPTVFDRFMLALLWTGCEEAALSHETALESYRVCDVNPSMISVTVAQRRRIRKSDGDNIALYYEDLTSRDLDWWEGMPCVRLALAIEQCLRTGTASYLLDQAIENGRKQGLISRFDAERLSDLVEARNDEGETTGYSLANVPNEESRQGTA